MRIGVYQNHSLFGQVDYNIEEAMESISRINADLMVMPELFNTGYQFISKKELQSLAEDIPSGKTCQAMLELAQKKDMFLVFGIAEKDQGHCYNSAVALGPQGFIGKYQKTHLFDNEKRFFDPGNSGFEVFDLGPAKIGIMICFDWWFPEAARVLALKGAQIICHPSNLVLDHCQDAMRIRSLENGVFSLTSNRIGTEARGTNSPLTFTGQSQIIDNKGQILRRMKKTATGIVLANIDAKQAINKKITPLNDRFKDRRPEFYQPLIKSNKPYEILPQ